jgi:serine/threonine protein kinase
MNTMMPWRILVQLSEYFLGRLRGDGEFTLYRAHAEQIEPPSVLLPAPDSTRPSTETLEKIDHECSLRSALKPDFAVRPLALSERGAPITLVLEDPGGETLDGYLEAMEIKQFLGLAVGFTTTLEALHERELIHKGVKPTNDLAHSLTDQAGLMDFGSPPAFCASTRPPNLQGSSPEQCLTCHLNEPGERITRSTPEATCMPSTAHFTRCSTATCRLQLPIQLNRYIATSRDVRCRLTIERRVCRHVSLRS